jgi:hypothetical protein
MLLREQALMAGGLQYPVGGVAGLAVVQEYTATSSGTVAFTHPSPGYNGLLQILIAGHAGVQGYESGTMVDTDADGIDDTWVGDGNGGMAGSGESAVFQYACLGDEISFQLVSTASAGAAGELRFVVVGGSNNGKYCTVGSGHSSTGSTANHGPAATKYALSNAAFKVLRAGGGFSFGAGTYGPGVQSYSYSRVNGIATEWVYGSTGSGGLITNLSVTHGQPNNYYQGDGSFNSGLGLGGVVLAWINTQ